MDNIRRRAVYEAQNHKDGRPRPHELTYPQQRRLRKKLHRGLSVFKPKNTPKDVARGPIAPMAETFGDFGPVPHPDHVVALQDAADMSALPECEHLNHCERCGAVDDETCVTASGKPTKDHKGRNRKVAA